MIFLYQQENNIIKERNIHSILTHQIKNNRKWCVIYRDKNIQKVFKTYVDTGERPKIYPLS